MRAHAQTACTDEDGCELLTNACAPPGLQHVVLDTAPGMSVREHGRLTGAHMIETHAGVCINKPMLNDPCQLQCTSAYSIPASALHVKHAVRRRH